MQKLSYQPTHVPGMQVGESAFTIRQANDDDSERDMFNVRVLPSHGELSTQVLVRRLDHCSRQIATADGTGATFEEALLDAAAKLTAAALVTGADTQTVSAEDVGDLSAVLK